MKELLELLRSKRSSYHEAVEGLRKSLAEDMDEKLFDNVEVFGLKQDNYGAEKGVQLLDVIQALKNQVVTPKSMSKELDALRNHLVELERKIYVGLDDRREAKKALQEKVNKLSVKALEEVKELVDFDTLRVVSFKVKKLTSEQEKKLVEVMESESFVMLERHQGYFYRFVGVLNDKGSFKSFSHAVFNKLEGKVTEDRNFISSIETEKVEAKGFLEQEYHLF